jgi:hypothetical protein
MQTYFHSKLLELSNLSAYCIGTSQGHDRSFLGRIHCLLYGVTGCKPRKDYPRECVTDLVLQDDVPCTSDAHNLINLRPGVMLDANVNIRPL